MNKGAIDDIQFHQLILDAAYYLDRRLVINDFRLDSHLGNINGIGGLNINISDKIRLLESKDELDLELNLGDLK